MQVLDTPVEVAGDLTPSPVTPGTEAAAYTRPSGPDKQPEAVEGLLDNSGWDKLRSDQASQQDTAEVRCVLIARFHPSIFVMQAE